MSCTSPYTAAGGARRTPPLERVLIPWVQSGARRWWAPVVGSFLPSRKDITLAQRMKASLHHPRACVVCGIRVDVLLQCEKDKDQTGQASQGQAATGPGEKVSRDPQSLRAGSVGGVGGQAGWGSRESPGPEALHADPPSVWGEGPTAPPADPPGSLPCPVS